MFHNLLENMINSFPIFYRLTMDATHRPENAQSSGEPDIMLSSCVRFIYCFIILLLLFNITLMFLSNGIQFTDDTVSQNNEFNEPDEYFIQYQDKDGHYKNDKLLNVTFVRYQTKIDVARGLSSMQRDNRLSQSSILKVSSSRVWLIRNILYASAIGTC